MEMGHGENVINCDKYQKQIECGWSLQPLEPTF